jgi:DNA-binding transcriptional LysR family regulator
VVVLPEAAVRSGCQAGALTVLMRNVPIAVGGFGLITRRNYKLSPGAQLMLQALREMAAETYPDQHVQ